MKALVFGVSGQDGSYMADLLLSKGYEVYGMVRRASVLNLERLFHLADKINLQQGDITDNARLSELIRCIKPDEIYNFAAQSHVHTSFSNPTDTCRITGLGALNVFEASKQACPSAKIYQASSSEMFGNRPEEMINETTPFSPCSPYGIAKCFAHYMAHHYRDTYGMHISCGIAFNHESERRSYEFVTRKISLSVASIKAGSKEKLKLGNIDTYRDFSYAPDIVEAAWLMLQKEKPDDYILASGKSHSIREFMEIAFRAADLRWEDHVEFDENLKRPMEISRLCGDPTKAREHLGWTPKVDFKGMALKMIHNDILSIRNSSLRSS